MSNLVFENRSSPGGICYFGEGEKKKPVRVRNSPLGKLLEENLQNAADSILLKTKKKKKGKREKINIDPK